MEAIWNPFSQCIMQPLISLLCNSRFFDSRFLPSLLWKLLYSAKFNLTDHAGSELNFRDFRIAVLYISSFVFGIYVFISSCLAVVQPQFQTITGILIFSPVVACFCLGYYIVWLKLFAIYRYIICIEILSPIILVALVGCFSKLKRLGYFYSAHSCLSCFA